MKFEILNTSGLDSQGQLGKKWTLYSIDLGQIPPYITEVQSIEAASEKLNDQLAAVAGLATAVATIDPQAAVSDVLITGEYLSISDGTKSIVKKAFLSLIHH